MPQIGVPSLAARMGFLALVLREFFQCRKREKADQEGKQLLASLQTEVEELRQEAKKEDKLFWLWRARSTANDGVKQANDVMTHL
jgi:hypothetical protein